MDDAERPGASFVDLETEVDRLRAENAELRAAHGRLEEAQRLTGIGVWEWNPQTEARWWSPMIYEMQELPQTDTPPRVSERRVHPDDVAGVEAAIERARATGEMRAEWRILKADGSVRWLAASGKALAPDRMLGVTQDITERKQAEARLKLLLSELQHRVRNILSVVRSIVGRTVRSSENLEDLAMHLDGRLNTLARTQSVFTRAGVAAVDLEDLVREEMLAVAATESHVEIEGPPIRLKAQAAEAVALALHELATNAVKYGALATPTGRLTVRWRATEGPDGPRLSLEWRERGVAAIDLSPKHAGFGRELIERSLPYELGAATELEFAPGGVRALIELPLSDKVVSAQDEEEPA